MCNKSARVWSRVNPKASKESPPRFWTTLLVVLAAPSAWRTCDLERPKKPSRPFVGAAGASASGTGGQTGIVDGVEQVAALPFGDARDVVDEGAGRGSEPFARGRLLKPAQEVLQLRVGLVAGGGARFAERIRRDRAGDRSEHVEMPFDTACRADAVPVGRQRVFELVEDRVGAPFPFALRTAASTPSRRWWRTSSGGSSGARPVARDA